MFIIPAQKKKFKGFTLIELLIVIAILGILAAAILVAANPAKRTRQARDADRKSDIGQLATAMVAWQTTPGLGRFPGANATQCGITADAFTALTFYGDLKQVPIGPTGDNYCVSQNTGSTEASVWATMEDPTTAGMTGGTAVWCWASTQGGGRERSNSNNCIP